MLNKKLVVALISVAVLFLGIFSFAQTGNDDTIAPVITLLGKDEVTIEVGETYKDKGATALDDIDGNITDDITVDSSVDTGVVGKYTVTYNVSDAASNAAEEVTRTVNVVDTTAPVITLLGQPVLTIRLGATYTDAGATATDKYGGDLTANITKVSTVNTARVGRYTVTYNVSDSYGNAATAVVRTVNVVDTTDPIVILNGNEEITLDLGETYVEEGATATDNVDAVLTVDIAGGVNTNVVGVYTLTYSATDDSNNTFSLTRKVTVRPVIEVQKTGYTLDPEDVTGNTIIVEKGDTFTVPSATARLGFANSNAIVEGNVLSDRVGTYTLKYTFIFPMPVGTLTATPRVITVRVVDTTKPTAAVSYNTTELTNGNVIATLVNPSELITVTNNEGSLSYEFTSNDEFTFEFVDASGNTGSVTATVNNIDKIGPAVSFGTDGNAAYAKKASTTITVKDDSIIDNESLKYQWTQSTTRPTEDSFSKSFANGEAISSPSKVSGTYYLWILAKDVIGNPTIIKSNQFFLDDIKPVITGVKPNTNYNHSVTPIISEDNLERAELLIEATSQTIDFVSGTEINVEGRYVLTATDKAGNETVVNFYLDYTLPTIQNGNVDFANESSFNTDVNLIIFDRKLTQVKINDQIFKNEAKNKEYFTISNNNYSSDVTFRYQLTEEGTYTVIATDLSGNIIKKVFTVDTTDPVITIGDYITTPTNQNIIVTASTNEGSLNVESYTFEKNESFEFVATDAAGNTSSKVVTINNIDKVAPKVDVSTPTEGSYINTNDFKVNVKATDNFGLSKITINLYKDGTLLKGFSKVLNEGIEYAYEHDFSKLNLEDGSYYVKVNALDKTGKISNTITRKFVIDMTKPELKINLDRKAFINSEDIVKSVDKPEVEATDINLDGYKIINNANDKIVTLTSGLTVTFRRWQINWLKNGIYTIYAIDKAGNESKPFEVTIDNIAPTITSVTGNPTAWGTADVVLTVNATDNIGVTEYSFDGGTTWQTENTKTFTSTGVIKIKVKDKAGNISNEHSERVIYIDRQGPVIQLDGANEAKFYSTAHSRKITVSDNRSGVNASTLRYLWTENKDITVTSEMGETFISGSTISTPVGVSGKYFLIVIASDKLGNESIYKSKEFYLDNTFPVLKKIVASDIYFEVGTPLPPINELVEATDNYDGNIIDKVYILRQPDMNKIGDYLVEFYVKDSSGNRSYTPLRVHVRDTTFPVLKKIVASDIYFEVGTPLPPINELVEATDNYDGNIIDKVYILRQPDMNTIGDYLVEFYVKDSSGNRSYTPLRVHVRDTVVPEFTVSGNPINWTTENVILTVNATDNSNALADQPYSFDNGSTWQASNTKEFTSNQDVKILVKDFSGNISSLRTISIVKIDKNLPTITSVTGNPGNWTKEDVVLTVNASDAQSGLAVQAYSFDNGTTWQASNTKTFIDNREVKIIVKDIAGNLSLTYTVNITKIDKTLPTITFSGANPLILRRYDFTFLPRYAASASDNVDGDITNKMTFTTNLNVLEKGTYYITYEVTDSVGNKTIATRNVIVKGWFE